MEKGNAITNNFIIILKQKCQEADKHLEKAVIFDTYKNQVSLRAIYIDEIFVTAMFKYIGKIIENQKQRFIFDLEFKIPRWGIECVAFKINEDKDIPKLLDADVLKNILKKLYQENLYRISKKTLLPKHIGQKDLPLILLCMRKNIAPDIEDIILEFSGSIPRNFYRSLQQEAYVLSKSDNMEELNRIWYCIHKIKFNY